MYHNPDSCSKHRGLSGATGVAALALGLLAAAPAQAAGDPPAGQAITLHVNTLTGKMYFTGDPGSNISDYRITSPSSSLDDAHWVSFQDQSILNPLNTITAALPGQIVDWMEMAHTDAGFEDMACANMMDGMNGLPVTFDTAQRTYSIGNAFRTDGQRDLQFLFNVDLNYTPDYTGAVVYETVPEPAAAGILCAGGLVFLRRRRRTAHHQQCL